MVEAVAVAAADFPSLSSTVFYVFCVFNLSTINIGQINHAYDVIKWLLFWINIVLLTSPIRSSSQFDKCVQIYIDLF